ncbi:MAG TPA: YXWGXW repeat-containing protein [Kofleriaceae bacterium]|nr:YXWGXW repeat-containing protein [Kofleriaceae bacterium]
MRTRWLGWIGSAGLALAAQACVVRDTRPVNAGYGYGAQAGQTGQAAGGVTVGEPAPSTVASMPPEPLYEQMTVSPGFGYVWIDGYWHWNSYEWVWVSGRWVREQGRGFVYVQPYYDYADGAYVYMPGYWSSRERVPRGWNVRDHRDGRPTVVEPRARPFQPPPPRSR